jgi:NH3-dependent NAD+ synthetase
MQSVLRRLLAWLEAQADQAGGLAVPISGGTDSALCFWLCAQVFPRKTRGIYFGNALRCRAWFEQFGTVVDLPAPGGDQNPEVMRWAHLLDYCLKNDCWPVGSRNKTEDVCGLYSLPSRAASLLPIVGLWKGEVLRLCETIGMPKEIISSSLQPDPECGRPTEMAAISVEKMDLFLQAKCGEIPGERLSELTSGEIKYLETIYSRYKFKRNLPIKGTSWTAEVVDFPGALAAFDSAILARP